MRNYKKERENYHSRPEQMLRNAARKRARRALEREGKAERFDGKDVHHKDGNPLNNDPKNLSVVTQHYNRKEPRLREKKLKAIKAIIDKALKSEASSFAQAAAIAISKQKSGDYHKSGKKKGLRKTKHKNPDHPKAKTNKQRKKEKQWKEDMGSVTGPHIAGTGDDNTVHTKPKRKVKRRVSLIKGMTRKR